MTQAALAERVEMSRASIANIERGGQRLGLHQVYRITQGLGLADVSALLPAMTQAEIAATELVDIAEPEGGLSDEERRQVARFYGETGPETA